MNIKCNRRNEMCFRNSSNRRNKVLFCKEYIHYSIYIKSILVICLYYLSLFVLFQELGLFLFLTKKVDWMWKEILLVKRCLIRGKSKFGNILNDSTMLNFHS